MRGTLLTPYYILLLLTIPVSVSWSQTVAEDCLYDELSRFAALYMAGERDSALAVGRRLLPMAEAANDSVAQMNICLISGLILREQQREADALQVFGRGVALCGEHIMAASEARRQIAANLLCNLANVCYDLDCRGKCPDYARRAARIAMSTGQQDLHAMVLPYAGRLLLLTGHRVEALPLLERGIEAAHSLQLVDQQLLCASMLARAEDEAHQPAPGDNEWLSKAEELSAQATDPFVLGTYYQVVGKIQMRAGELRKAAESYAKIESTGALDHVSKDEMTRIVHKVDSDEQRRDSLAKAYEGVPSLVNGYRRVIVWTLAAVAVLFLAFAAYALWQRRQRRRREAQGRQKAEERFMEGMESERRRMAGELHDGVANDLLALQMKLESDGVTAETLEQLKESREGVRLVSHNLVPPEFDVITIDDALANYADKMDGVGGCQVCYTSSADDGKEWGSIAQRVALDIYRIAQEGVSNALKHSGATLVAIGLHWKHDTIELTVSDNGSQQSADSGGIGMTTMRQRAEAAGGRIDFFAHAYGTTLRLNLRQSC